jgi:hypothetical protein
MGGLTRRAVVAAGAMPRHLPTPALMVIHMDALGV